MLTGAVIAALIILVGSKLVERQRVKQEEIILGKLPESEAVAYYEHLRKRLLRTRIQLGVVLVSLVFLFRGRNVITAMIKRILGDDTP